MNFRRKITSVFLALCIAMSVVTCGIASVSATSSNDVGTVPVYKSRTAYVDSMNQGICQVKKEFSEGLDEVYSFTLENDADVMITYGFRNISDYGWSFDESFNVYRDPNLINEVELKETENNERNLYGTLAKGIYYIKVKSTYNKGDEFFLYIGQIKKNTKYFSLSLSKAINGGKSVELKIDGVDPVSVVKLDVSNHSEIHPSSIWTTDYTPDEKGKFIVVIPDENGSYLNGIVIDAYGYEYNINNRLLLPFVSTVTGIKNKEYTGKNIKQTGLVVKSGYDNVPYTVSYKNNKNVGMATITLHGANGALGSITKSFKINPGKIAKASWKIKGKTASLSWSKSKGAKMYVLQKKVGSKWKNVKNLSKTNYKVTVKKGKNQFRVYGTKTVNKVKFNSAFKNFTVKVK